MIYITCILTDNISIYNWVRLYAVWGTVSPAPEPQSRESCAECQTSDNDNISTNIETTVPGLLYTRDRNVRTLHWELGIWKFAKRGERRNKAALIMIRDMKMRFLPLLLSSFLVMTVSCTLHHQNLVRPAALRILSVKWNVWLCSRCGNLMSTEEIFPGETKSLIGNRGWRGSSVSWSRDWSCSQSNPSSPESTTGAVWGWERRPSCPAGSSSYSRDTWSVRLNLNNVLWLQTITVSVKAQRLPTCLGLWLS